MKFDYQTYKTSIGLVVGATILYIIKGYLIIPCALIFVAFLSVVFKSIGVIITKFTDRFFHILGKSLSTLILVLLYYVILTPLAVFSRAFVKKDNLKLKKPEQTNFVQVNKSFDKAGFEKLW